MLKPALTIDDKGFRFDLRVHRKGAVWGLRMQNVGGTFDWLRFPEPRNPERDVLRIKIHFVDGKVPYEVELNRLDRTVDRFEVDGVEYVRGTVG